MVAIHPAYSRRGHASRLIHYTKDLSKKEGIQNGAVSVPSGKALVEYLGFKVHEVYHVQANDELDTPQEVHIAASLSMIMYGPQVKSNHFTGERCIKPPPWRHVSWRPNWLHAIIRRLSKSFHNLTLRWTANLLT